MLNKIPQVKGRYFLYSKWSVEMELSYHAMKVFLAVQVSPTEENMRVVTFAALPHFSKMAAVD